MGNKNSNSSNIQISVYHNNSKITNSNKSISTKSQLKSNQVKSKEVKSEEVKPSVVLDEVKSEEVKPSVALEEVKSEEVKPSVALEEVKSEEVKPSVALEEVKSEEVKPSVALEEVKSEEVKPSVALEEVKSEEVKSEPVLSEIMLNIVKLFASKEEVADIIKLLKLDITEETRKKLVDLLELLTQDTSEDNIILSIANETKKMLSDNKIDVYDIPSFIKIATDVFSVKLNIGDIKKVETSDVCKLIEIICVGLVKKNIINLDSTIEDENLIRGITSSISLLETTIKISKSSCFCCKKK
jgi:hypothetical protein